jgi:integrase
MLTDAAIRRLQPKPSAYRVFCPSVPGFGVKVLPSGGKVYELRSRGRYHRLGAVGLTPLGAAREKARAILSRLDQGLPAVPAPDPSASLATLLDAWLAHQRAQNRRRIDDTERLLRRNLPPALLAKPAKIITPADIRAVLAVCHQRGARVLSNRLRAHLHGLFQWGLRADHDPARLADPVLFAIDVNPVSAIPRDAGAERPGERVLFWGEVRAVWHTETGLSWIARQAVRLLLATGQRVNEVCQASWAEFDLEAGVWTIPAARSKGKRDHLVPLGPLAVELLVELREVYPGPWLFPARNMPGATQPWGNTALGHACRACWKRLDMPPWEGRDLRRTWKTLAGEVGLPLDIRNRIQGHGLQDVGSKHYDRHNYLGEKRAATLQWERALAARLAGDNVRVISAGRKIGGTA